MARSAMSRAVHEGWLLEADMAKFAEEYAMDCMMDKERNLVCLFPNEYRLNLAIKNFENLKFAETSQG